MRRVYIGFRGYDPKVRRTRYLFSIRAENFPSPLHVRQVVLDALEAEAARLRRQTQGVAHVRPDHAEHR